MSDSGAAEMIYELEADGHKLTRLRQAVIEIFSRRRKPLLLDDLGRLLHDRFITVHRATLYRELDFLEAKKIIVPVSLEDGRLRYEFAAREHHHHIVCTKCKTIADVEVADDAEQLSKMIKAPNNFKITHHALEFFGVCGDCT